MHRVFTVTALAAAVAGPALSQGVEDFDPADLVPRYFSAEDFADLDALDLYDVNLALKRGRTIRLADCSPSQSRAIFTASHEARAPLLDMLRTTCTG